MKMKKAVVKLYYSLYIFEKNQFNIFTLKLTLNYKF